MVKKKSKPTKKDQALQEYTEYLKEKGMIKKSFDEKLNSMIKESFEELQKYSALELIEKCGKGPSTGFVDGVQYIKDNMQKGNKWGQYKRGDVEREQILKQQRAEEDYRFTGIGEDEVGFVGDIIGYQIHGEDYFSPNMTVDESDELARFVDDGSYYDGRGASTLDGLVDTIESDFNGDNDIGLVANTMLYSYDMPNPELQEGDVFELDTVFPATFKKGENGVDGNTSIDTATIRSNNEPYYNDVMPKSNTDGMYEVTVLGTEGTPILVNGTPSNYDDLSASYNGYWYNGHTALFGKGQKIRVVRINHEKKTAIYQTVDG